MLKAFTFTARALLFLVVASLAAPAIGDIAFSTDRLGYTGSVTVYNTLADAQNEVNAVSGPHVAPQRDLAIFFNNNTHYFDQDYSVFLTAWYYTTNTDNGEYSGWGNPNNTNTGFIQMYDIGAMTSQTVTGEFSTLNVGVAGASAFTLNASGTNADYNDAFSRFWHAPNTGGAGALTVGEFHEWALDVTVGGLTVNEIGTWYIADNHPNSVTGSLTGIFENTNTSDASLNGFYRYDYDLNMTNWAWDNQGDLFGAFSDSFFAAAVPEPSTGLAAFSIVGLAFFRRKRS